MFNRCVSKVTCLGLVLIAGCGGFFLGPSEGMYIVGVDGDHVYLQYYPEDSGFTVLPSSIWSLDLATTQTKRIHEATPQSGVHVSGDHYAAELVRDGETWGKVVTYDISTGRRTDLYERAIQPATAWPSIHAISGDRVVVLAEGELRVFDVADGTLLQTIDVPDDAYEVAAFEGNLVLLTIGGRGFDEEEALLVNLSSEDQLVIPPPPGGGQPVYPASALTPRYLAVASQQELDAATARNEVLLFDIPSATWRVFAQDDSYPVDSFSFPVLFVYGLDDARVIVERFDALAASKWAIEAIDLESAERTVITGGTLSPWTAFPTTPLLLDGRLYWLDPALPRVVVHDLESGHEQSVLIDLAR